MIFYFIQLCLSLVKTPKFYDEEPYVFLPIFYNLSKTDFI